MSLTVAVERSAQGLPTLVVRFPFGGGGRRQSLLTAGWQLEPNEYGTRYFVRRFEAPAETPLDDVVAAIRQAYAVVYGPGLTFTGWTGRFWVVSVADLAAVQYRRDIAPTLSPRRRRLGFLLTGAAPSCSWRPSGSGPCCSSCMSAARRAIASRSA